MDDIHERSTWAIVTCADGRMAPAACAVLLNAMKMSPPGVRLFLVGVALDGLAKQNVADFSRIKNCPIELFDFSLGNLKNHDVGRFGLAALARLYLDQLLPRNLDRVLYLDADVYVASPLRNLFEFPLDGYPIGAVTDISKHGPAHVSKRSLELGMGVGKSYVMSGMLLFAWPMSLSSNGLSASRDALAAGKNFKFPDQDAINLGFNGDYKPIAPAWNAEPFLWKILNKVHIYHFSGKIKPWDVAAPAQYHRFRSAFKAALDGTPWKDWIEPRSASQKWKVLADSILFAVKTRKKQMRVAESYGRSAFGIDDAQN